MSTSGDGKNPKTNETKSVDSEEGKKETKGSIGKAEGDKKRRERRRSNPNTAEKSGNRSGSSRSGSRNNSQGGGNEESRRQSGGGNKQRKEWAEGSRSQGSKDEGNQRTKSTQSQNGKRSQRNSARTASQASGDGYEYSDEYELDEPFSDSEDESSGRQRAPQKMNLAIPRGRIRTLSGTVPIVGFSPKWGGPTMCLSCLQFFDLPDQMEQFESHLLFEHRIVVSEMSAIVDPKRYIEYWRQRFAKESIDNIFSKVEPAEGEPRHGVVEYYYSMSEHLPEDYSLRQRLAMRRLEEALSCQQREREDGSFQQQCIFCRYTARGNRSKIIHHLYMIHHLNLGSPDNLVFVTEYIEHLKEKLQRNECIYCEKVFQDRNTLMDHMRKRNHREVNPKNHYYDKFYIINYLELGKRWLDVLAEDFEDTMPTFQDSDDDDEDNSWCEWQEDNVEMDETRVLCLICEHSEDTTQALLDHMKTAHEFDIMAQIREHDLDMYQRLKLINYIRKQNYNATCWVCQKSDFENPLACNKHLLEHKPLKKLPDNSVWDVEENLVPLFGNDHFLWMLESTIEESEKPAEGATSAESGEKRGITAIVNESKKNTVEGVIAEDLPELHELGDEELAELV